MDNPVQGKPPGTRIFVPVFLAILAAMAVAGVAYRFLVQIPERKATDREAARRLFSAESDQRMYDPITGLTTGQLELKLKADDPDSPCNSLESTPFAMCASSETRDQQKSIAELAEKQKQQPK